MNEVIKDYQILTGTTAGELQIKVIKALKDGWLPMIGSPAQPTYVSGGGQMLWSKEMVKVEGEFPIIVGNVPTSGLEN